MKKILGSIFIALCFAHAGIAQEEVDEKLNEARSAYSGGDLENTRFALQQALQEVDIVIGREVLKLLPQSIAGVSYNEPEDDVTGMSGGFAGLFVSRTYGGEGENAASIEIVSDSPLLAGINAILAMPMIMNSGDSGQKRIKVDGYKALLQRSDNGDGSVSYEVQAPFGSSLLTFRCEGVASEKEAEALANTIPVAKIAEMVR